LYITKDDSINIIKSKVFKIIDFFETYEFTFQMKKLDKKQRQIIHITLDENSNNIFHYTRKGERTVSNDENLRKFHNKYHKLKGIDKAMVDKVDIINDKLTSLNLTAVQQNSLISEKSSFSSSISISQETEEIVKAAIANTENKLLCKLCSETGTEKLCDGEIGLRIHTNRMHKNLIKK
jgi:hypothetical protein